MEIQTGSRRTPNPLQVTLARLRAQRSDPALAMPPGSVHDGVLLKVRDAVRLREDLNGTPGGSEGVILGWYSNEPAKVVVRLSEGDVETLPREVLELIDTRSVA